MKPKPSSLFRYESVSLQSLRNLQNRAIHLGPPRSFNDPYDCALGGSINELTTEQLQEVYRATRGREMPSGVDSLLRAQITGHGRRLLSEYVEDFLDKRGVSCFTERNDNLLMWSHYADGGRGICLEFSTEERLFEKAGPVVYSDKIPSVDLGTLILRPGDMDVMGLLFRTKSSHWEYEAEWRVLHEKAGTNWTYEDKSLKGVYLGPSIPHDLANIVCLIARAQNPSANFYQGRRSSSEFLVEFDEITLRRLTIE